MPVIYALADPRTGDVRYVGKTSRKLSTRLRQHVNRSAKPETRCACWIRALVALGLVPDARELEVVSEEQWPAAERRWISALRAEGADLTNLTEGGAATHGHKHSAATKARISAIATAQFASPAAREKAADYARAAWADPTYRARTAASRSVATQSEAYRQRQSEAKLALWQTDDYRASVAAGQKGRHTAGALSMWQRPEYREAQARARAIRYGKNEALR